MFLFVKFESLRHVMIDACAHDVVGRWSLIVVTVSLVSDDWLVMILHCVGSIH